MALIIALVLGCILFVWCALDKSAAGAHDRQFRARWAGIEEFEHLYTDRDLEGLLQEFIDDKSNYERVNNAVHTALEGVYIMESLRRAALDVLLAQRGKISQYRAEHGYDAYISDNTKRCIKARFEYAERIMTIANQNGCPAKLVCVNNPPRCLYYAWEGSFAATRPGASFKPFDRKLIEDRFAELDRKKAKLDEIGAELDRDYQSSNR